MSDCPLGKRGITACAWALANAAIDRGISVHVSTGPVPGRTPAMKFTCTHGNGYWVYPLEKA